MPHQPESVIQLSFPFLRTPNEPRQVAALDVGQRADARISDHLMEELHERLGVAIGRPLDLVGTDNRRSLLSWKEAEGGVLQVRIQRQFALGDDALVLDLADLIQHDDPGARVRLKEFAKGFEQPRRRRRPQFAPPAGRFHDLREHLAEQARRFFSGDFDGKIGWSRRSTSKVRRTIRLGSWSPRDRLIRVHPVLDSEAVPAFVLGFVVFHEMLHSEVGIERIRGRRRVHPEAFTEREQSHPDHGRAQLWIARNLDLLLSY